MDVYLNEIDDIKQKVIPQLIHIIYIYPKESQQKMLLTFVKDRLLSNDTNKQAKVQLMKQLFEMFNT